MDIRDFDAVVAKHDLNEHPFYRAWRAGTLPPSALLAYAGDYAPFIGAIENGWRALGDDAHADEERDHAALWERFRTALAARGFAHEGAHANAPAKALAEHALRAFADPAEAVGALYAFEAQQPSTARSKLEGLRQHYAMYGEDAAYSRVRAVDHGERDRLAARAETMTAEERTRALGACEATCLAMWAALDGALPAGFACEMH